jgi:exodeoxyribonuclease V alpha subunit
MKVLSEKIELKATVVKKIFYNEDSMFGVYAFEPSFEDKGKIELNKWENFTVSGNIPELFVGKTYEIIIEPSNHPKYGKGYSFIAIKQKRPTTVEEQQAYIRAMLKESQAKAIIQKYPNEKILDLMKEDKFDYSDIKGIKEKTYQRIKKYLFDNLEIQEALVELRELNITFKAMKKLIDHYGSPEVVVHKVKDNIYNLCNVDGFGFDKVDKYALKRGDSKTNQNRIIAAIKYTLEKEANEGHSWTDINKLIDKAKELLQIDKEYIEKAIEFCREEVKELYFSDDKVGLYKNYFYEREILKKLQLLYQTKNEFTDEEIQKRILEVEERLGVAYTHEQKKAIEKALKYNVFILNGKGGVGKTFTVQGILEALNDKSYCCCALSGKAAKILADKELTAKTIHRMLGVNPDGSFTFNRKDRLPYDVIVLDEASMVNNYLFYSVVSALRDDAKFIIVGDSGQLPAIGTGSVFEDLLNANVFPQQELTIVQRQAAKSGILSTANIIRDGHQINERYSYEKQVYGELKDMVLIPVQNRENIKDIVLDICRKYNHNDMNEFQVITALKERGSISVKKLNQELQKIFNDVTKPFVQRKGYEYREGDKIIQCGNNYEAGINGDLSVFNGTLGKIVKIDFLDQDKYQVWIQFDGIEELVPYTKEELDQIELAYAITVHRSQGSTIKHVLFVFDYTAYKLLSRQLVYTGITRASKGCVMVCENGALHHAIRTNHSGLRRTFLKEMLKEGVYE